MKKFPFCLCLFLTLGFSTRASFGFEKIFNFENDIVDSPPNGLILEGNDDRKPLFIVQKEPEKKNNVLALSGSTFKSNNPLACLAWFSNLKNGSISVDFMHSGQPDTIRRAGLIWRYTSVTDTYFLECDTVKSVMRFGIFSGVKKKIIEDARVNLPPAQWINVGVDFKDDHMTFLLQGKPVFEVHDTKIPNEGKVGIYLDSDVAVVFDNFKIQSSD